jgi:hypothetical protein
MRIPRVQFTIGRMMIAVAVIATVLGAGIEGMRLKRFRDQYLHRAKIHAYLEQSLLGTEAIAGKAAAATERLTAEGLELVEKRARGAQSAVDPAFNQTSIELYKWEQRIASEYREIAARYAKLAAHHSALKKKYRRAADRPWSSVEPDGPEPWSSVEPDGPEP